MIDEPLTVSSSPRSDDARETRVPGGRRGVRRCHRVRRSLAVLSAAAAFAFGAAGPVSGAGGSSERIAQSVPGCDPSAPTTCTLRELADLRGVRVGGTLDVDTLAIAAHTEVMRREFNALTPENALKWYSVQNERGTFQFAGADAVVQFATENGMDVRGHTLVWAQDQFTPAWVTEIVDGDEMRAELETHIGAVMGRYRDRIHRWDVVNEPLENPLGGGSGTDVGDNVFRRTLGELWIDEIFAMAHAQDPDAELWLNEVGTEYSPARHEALLDLLRGLLGRGVPVDGVGLQTHRFSPDGPDEASFIEQLRDFEALGLRVAITELDVATSPDDAEALTRQAGTYGRIVRACLAVVACEEVTTWGVSDARTWLDSDLFPFLAKPTRPLLFDDRYRPKPAYDAVRAALATGRPGPAPAPAPAPAPVPAPSAPPPAVPVAGAAAYTG